MGIEEGGVWELVRAGRAGVAGVVRGSQKGPKWGGTSKELHSKESVFIF